MPIVESYIFGDGRKLEEGSSVLFYTYEGKKEREREEAGRITSLLF